ncbi:MAG: hypothetical protein H7222_06210 [Methylotenera sp.]|nr:hypothetical protein [Oligoflexia bacterium]
MKFSNLSLGLTLLVACGLFTAETSFAAKRTKKTPVVQAPEPVASPSPVPSPVISVIHSEALRQGSEYVFQPTFGVHAIQPFVQYTTAAIKL